MNLEFEASMLTDLAGSDLFFSRPFAAEDHEPHWLGTRLDLALKDQEPGRRLVVHGLALEILGRLADHEVIQDNPPSWLEEARDLLRDCHAQAVRIADIAQTVGVHPVHLTRTFRRHFGMTSGQYRRAHR